MKSPFLPIFALALLSGHTFPADSDTTAKPSQIDREIYYSFKEVTMEASQFTGFFGYGFLVNETPSPPATKPKSGPAPLDPRISGVFTDPQFQVVIRALGKQKGVDLVSSPAFTARSGVPATAEFANRRWGVIGTIGSDGFTIDLELYRLKRGETWLKDGKAADKPAATLTIWDGQSFSYSEPIGEAKEKVRIVLVTAKMIDPSGKAVAPLPTDPFTHADFLLKADEKLEIYEVKKGDTLHKIATEHETTVARIKSANRMQSDMFRIGDKILVPVKMAKSDEDSNPGR